MVLLHILLFLPKHTDPREVKYFQNPFWYKKKRDYVNRSITERSFNQISLVSIEVRLPCQLEFFFSIFISSIFPVYSLRLECIRTPKYLNRRSPFDCTNQSQPCKFVPLDLAHTLLKTHGLLFSSGQFG
jgi:hypothetical protein